MPTQCQPALSPDSDLNADAYDRLSVSVIIPTYNEQDNIRETVGSVMGWVETIIVFDSFSIDRTVEIAQELNAKVIQRRFDNFATHKNWALDNIPFQTDWVFFLDADERVSQSLRREITRVLREPTASDGYYVARRNYFMGGWIRHAGMYPDWQLDCFVVKRDAMKSDWFTSMWFSTGVPPI